MRCIFVPEPLRDSYNCCELSSPPISRRDASADLLHSARWLTAFFLTELPKSKMHKLYFAPVTTTVPHNACQILYFTSTHCHAWLIVLLIVFFNEYKVSLHSSERLRVLFLTNSTSFSTQDANTAAPDSQWLRSDASSMVHFLCQLHWTMGCPDTWSTLFWVCLQGCFWMRLLFESGDRGKQVGLPRVDRPQIN